MNEQLERLIKLQDIDSKIIAINHIMQEFPGKLAEAETPLRELQHSLSSIKQQIDTLDKKKRERERVLDDLSERITKLKARTSDIKTNKEYQALLKEIESVEKESSSIEDDILTVMDEIDAATKKTKSEEIKFRAENEKVEVLKKKLEIEKAEVGKELSSLKAVRSQIVDSIDKEWYDQYIVLIEINSGVAVTEVKGEICQGCNMYIPPQLFVEIKKNEEITSCPQCRRFIYFVNAPE
jgi:predicted  nucleic acid-binding Zn-ribbon protein